MHSFVSAVDVNFILGAVNGGTKKQNPSKLSINLFNSVSKQSSVVSWTWSGSCTSKFLSSITGTTPLIADSDVRQRHKLLMKHTTSMLGEA